MGITEVIYIKFINFMTRRNLLTTVYSTGYFTIFTKDDNITHRIPPQRVSNSCIQPESSRNEDKSRTLERATQAFNVPLTRHQ